MLADGMIPVLEIDAAMYGLIRSVFCFERGRDGKINARNFTQLAKSIWKFEYDGKTAYLGVYIDDFFCCGHGVAVDEAFRVLGERLREQEHGADAVPIVWKEPPQIGTKTLMLGQAIELELGAEVAVIRITQNDYNDFWIAKFEEQWGRKVSGKDVPGCAPSLNHDGESIFTDEEWMSYVMAMQHTARCTHPELLQPCQSLATRRTTRTDADDLRLAHAFGYLKRHGSEPFVMTVHYWEKLTAVTYVDSDHGSCRYSRRSTSGLAVTLEGDTTMAAVLCRAKMHTHVSRSSGEGEVKGVDDALEGMNVFYEQADHVHGIARHLAQKGINLLDQIETMGLTSERVMLTDATVALLACEKGRAKVLSYLNKTLGIDLEWVRETLETLNMPLRKVPSELNLADLMTKAVTRGVLRKLLNIMRSSPA